MEEQQPRLLKDVYKQVSEHPNYRNLPYGISDSLDDYFTYQQREERDVTHLLNMMDDIRSRPSYRQYMHKTVREAWGHLFLGNEIY